MCSCDDKLIANPSVVLREEFDDWAVLFDPESGQVFGSNPIGVFIFRRLDGRHTIGDIVTELHSMCEDVPDDVDQHVQEFIDDMVKIGFAGYEAQDG